MLHTSVVTRTDGFFGLRDDWFGLIERSSSATVFDTFEWQFSWWKHIGTKIAGARPLIVLIRDEQGVLRGIFPFYTKFWLVSPFRLLLFVGSGSSDYHDIIAADGSEQAVAEELTRWLALGQSWSFADLNQLREGGLIRQYVNLAQVGEFKYIGLEQEECPFADLPGLGEPEDRWNQLLNGYSKKMRGNIRYYNRSLDTVYDVQRRIASTEEETLEALDALFELHQRRWNQRWLPGAFYSRSLREFHCEAAVQLLSRGWLRLHWIQLDETIEAVLYCFFLNKVTSYYQGGFEPALARLSLGTVVTGLAVHQAIADNCVRFDFLRGDEEYKKRWTKGTTAWNHRWLVGLRDSKLFSLAAAHVQLELRVEQRFKQWMHHRKSGRPPGNAETVAK